MRSRDRWPLARVTALVERVAAAVRPGAVLESWLGELGMTFRDSPRNELNARRRFIWTGPNAPFSLGRPVELRSGGGRRHGVSAPRQGHMRQGRVLGPAPVMGATGHGRVVGSTLPVVAADEIDTGWRLRVGLRRTGGRNGWRRAEDNGRGQHADDRHCDQDAGEEPHVSTASSRPPPGVRWEDNPRTNRVARVPRRARIGRFEAVLFSAATKRARFG